MMKYIFTILLTFVVASPSLDARIMPPHFNVLNYGASGDGQTDDSKAFVRAWQDVCGASQGIPTLIIPKGKMFMLQPVSFQGPCKPSAVKIKLQGTIIAPNSIEAWKWPDSYRNAWIRFSGISNLVIDGHGRIDGQGAPWWKCVSSSSCVRPTALHFHACDNLKLSRLTHINSPQNHIGIDGCNSSQVSNLHIIAPGESPNTDGIDISSSSYVTIQNSKMETGDDCIAINGGSTFINITNIICGPGHGISIGSLGKNGAYEIVEEIHVRNCTFNGTTNGARIKTWEGGSGHANKITFEDIILFGAKNPVIIDQQYNPHYNDGSAVKVNDVTYRNVRGTSSSANAIQLNCDHTVPCTNIVLENINITSATGDKIYASCQNAQGTCSSCIPNVLCLSRG